MGTTLMIRIHLSECESMCISEQRGNFSKLPHTCSCMSATYPCQPAFNVSAALLCCRWLPWSLIPHCPRRGAEPFSYCSDHEDTVNQNTYGSLKRNLNIRYRFKFLITKASNDAKISRHPAYCFIKNHITVAVIKTTYGITTTPCIHTEREIVDTSAIMKLTNVYC